jgi:RNA polymerase sigma factor (sigma-70 family)
LSSEQSSWNGLKNGDIPSLESLYNLYNGQLYGYGKKFTTDTHLIQDAIQETFISLWKYKSSANKFYLIKSFRNQLLKLIKERAKTKYTDETIDFSFEVGFDKTLIAGEESEQLSRQLKAALNQLTPRQREIIYFRFFENLSFEEIAGIMNMQVRATYKLTARALEALKELIGTTLFLSFLKII